MQYGACWIIGLLVPTEVIPHPMWYSGQILCCGTLSAEPAHLSRCTHCSKFRAHDKTARKPMTLVDIGPSGFGNYLSSKSPHSLNPKYFACCLLRIIFCTDASCCANQKAESSMYCSTLTGCHWLGIRLPIGPHHPDLITSPEVDRVSSPRFTLQHRRRRYRCHPL